MDSLLDLWEVPVVLDELFDPARAIRALGIASFPRLVRAMGLACWGANAADVLSKFLQVFLELWHDALDGVSQHKPALQPIVVGLGLSQMLGWKGNGELFVEKAIVLQVQLKDIAELCLQPAKRNPDETLNPIMMWETLLTHCLRTSFKTPLGTLVGTL
jgi:hypothetical protein